MKGTALTNHCICPLFFQILSIYLNFSNWFKMSNTENDAIEDLTKINGKSVDAIGHVVFKMV